MNFSVIGDREERGVRMPSFSESHPGGVWGLSWVVAGLIKVPMVRCGILPVGIHPGLTQSSQRNFSVRFGRWYLGAHGLFLSLF